MTILKGVCSILLLIIVFSCGSVKSQDYNQVHKLIIDGINSIYDIDFPGALNKFQQAKNIAPYDLRGPFFESSVYFWKALFARNRGDYETYLDLSKKLKEKCENIIDKNENDLDAQFYLGWTNTLRAFIIYMTDQNALQAASDIQDGNKALTFVVEKNPSYYDAYLGLGIYNYIISFIPRKLQWLTNILGFTGDREEGKRQLKLASEKGTYTNTEAKFYLTLLAWREENYPLAEDYCSQLTTSFPQSPAVWMLRGLLFSQQDKMQDAVEAYEKAIDFNKGKESDIVYKTCYGALGTAYYRMNNFEKAAEFGNKYMSLVTKDDRINNRLYSIGVSLELLGRRDEAVNFYKQAKTDFIDKSEWEKFWFRRLNYRMNNRMTIIDSLLAVADNDRAIGKLSEALEDYTKLNALFDQKYSDDIYAQINIGTGQVYFKQKDYDKAIEQFKLNLNLKPNEEKWLVPEAYYQIGRCLLRLGRKQDATEYFNKALDIDYDYDFKDAMDDKIKNELAKYP